MLKSTLPFKFARLSAFFSLFMAVLLSLLALFFLAACEGESAPPTPPPTSAPRIPTQAPISPTPSDTPTVTATFFRPIFTANPDQPTVDFNQPSWTPTASLTPSDTPSPRPSITPIPSNTPVPTLGTGARILADGTTELLISSADLNSALAEINVPNQPVFDLQADSIRLTYLIPNDFLRSSTEVRAFVDLSFENGSLSLLMPNYQIEGPRITAQQAREPLPDIERALQTAISNISAEAYPDTRLNLRGFRLAADFIIIEVERR